MPVSARENAAIAASCGLSGYHHTTRPPTSSLPPLPSQKRPRPAGFPGTPLTRTTGRGALDKAPSLSAALRRAVGRPNSPQRQTAQLLMSGRPPLIALAVGQGLTPPCGTTYQGCDSSFALWFNHILPPSCHSGKWLSWKL